MNLFLVRHGEILSNLKRIYAGRSSESLTEKGIQQAYETARRLSFMNIHALYTSPIKRAVETAEIIGEVIGKDFEVMSEFREMEMGSWEGMSEERISRLYPEEWSTWLKRPAELSLDGRETLNQLLNRALNGVRKIMFSHSGQNIVIVTHVAIIRVLHLWHNKKDLNLYKTVTVSNAQIFKLKIPGSRF